MTLWCRRIADGRGLELVHISGKMPREAVGQQERPPAGGIRALAPGELAAAMWPNPNTAYLVGVDPSEPQATRDFWSIVGGKAGW